MAELASSLRVLGVRERGFLVSEDGTCDQAAPGDVVPPLFDLTAEVGPDIVVTFGPDRITGDPDHMAVSRWVTETSSTAIAPTPRPGTSQRSPAWPACPATDLMVHFGRS